MNQNKKRITIKWLWIIFNIIIITSLVMFLFWWVPSMMTYENIAKFECTGVIGDTVGGLTAPVIGLFGAVLIYYSFLAQRNANKIQIDALRDDRIRVAGEQWMNAQMLMIHDIKSRLNNFEFQYPVKLSDDANLLKSDFVTFNSKNALLLLSTEYELLKGVKVEEDSMVNLKRIFIDYTIDNFALILTDFKLLTRLIIRRYSEYPNEVITLIEQLIQTYHSSVQIDLAIIINSLEEDHKIYKLKKDLKEIYKDVHQLYEKFEKEKGYARQSTVNLTTMNENEKQGYIESIKNFTDRELLELNTYHQRKQTDYLKSINSTLYFFFALAIAGIIVGIIAVLAE